MQETSTDETSVLDVLNHHGSHHPSAAISTCDFDGDGVLTSTSTSTATSSHQTTNSSNSNSTLASINQADAGSMASTNQNLAVPIEATSSTTAFYKRTLVGSQNGNDANVVWTVIEVPSAYLNHCGTANDNDAGNDTATRPTQSAKVTPNAETEADASDFYKQALHNTNLNEATSSRQRFNPNQQQQQRDGDFYKGTLAGRRPRHQLAAGNHSNTTNGMLDDNDGLLIPEPNSKQVVSSSSSSALYSANSTGHSVQAQTVYDDQDDDDDDYHHQATLDMFSTTLPMAIVPIPEEVDTDHCPASAAVYDGTGRPVTSLSHVPLDEGGTEDDDNGPKDSLSFQKRRQRRQRRRCYVLCGMMTIALACVATIASIVVCNHHRCDSRASSRGNSINNTPVSTTDLPTVPASPELIQQVIYYIQSITLTNQTFTEAKAANIMSTSDTNISNTTNLSSEQWAVQQLLRVNHDNLSTDTLAHQFRWRQRYALATLLVTATASTATASTAATSTWPDRHLDGDECSWWGVFCEPMDLGGDIGVQNVSVQIDWIDIGLTGTLSADLGLLSLSLRHVNVSFNALTGSLPSSIGQWTRLQEFCIVANRINGSLPQSIGQWTDLIIFDVGPNKLTGTLPLSIGQWTRLEFFGVSINTMHGTLPAAALGNWSHLEHFSPFANRYLTGRLPDSVGVWSNLKYMDAAWNQFTGPLPESIGQWTKVEIVSFTLNNLTGTLPSSIGNWNLVERAYFGRNNFTGSVPTSICINKSAASHIFVVDGNIPCQCC